MIMVIIMIMRMRIMKIVTIIIMVMIMMRMIITTIRNFIRGFRLLLGVRGQKGEVALTVGILTINSN